MHSATEEPEVIEAPEPELAPDEAEAAEAEEEHEAQPGEGELEPDAAPGLTPEQLEKAFKAIERAFTSYTSKVNTALGEQAHELTDCPLCAGTVQGFVLIEGAGRVDEETKAAVETYLGVVQEADYPDDPAHHTCDACNGLGMVRTGSRVPKWTTLTCSACLGHGFVPPPGAYTATSGTVAAGQLLTAADAPAGPRDDVDPNGSPRLLPDGTENPNYGKWPQFKDPRWP